MPTTAELYNQELLEGHREAIAALRALLADEKDPLERRKLANALLRARPVKLPDAAAAEPQPPHHQRRADKPTLPKAARAANRLNTLLAKLGPHDSSDPDRERAVTPRATAGGFAIAEPSDPPPPITPLQSSTRA